MIIVQAADQYEIYTPLWQTYTLNLPQDVDVKCIGQFEAHVSGLKEGKEGMQTILTGLLRSPIK